MAESRINNLKLGIFTIAGILFLVISLYMIGKDQNLFGSNITISTRMRNAGGLVSGNNVRYSGIQVGTVSEVNLLSDTSIEIIMLIDEDAADKILNTSIASLGTEGLIGNRIVNLTAGQGTGRPIREGDVITAKKTTDTDQMLETLSTTNQNAAELSSELLTAVKRLNGSSGLWRIIENDTLAADLKTTLQNIRKASENTNKLTSDLNGMVNYIKSGNGSAGKILFDTTLATQLGEALSKLNHAASNAAALTEKTDQLLTGIKHDIESGNGPANAILKDSGMVVKLHNTLTNVESSTAAFNANMEALKHNFLLRGYFRKQEKIKAKDSALHNQK